jgi:hypothetical protein
VTLTHVIPEANILVSMKVKSQICQKKSINSVTKLPEEIYSIKEFKPLFEI